MAALTERLRLATRDAHREAERAGIMRALVAGRLDLPRYTLLLRNLHTLYETLERSLGASSRPLPIPLETLARTRALAADLAYLHGTTWSLLPLSSAMHEYAERVRDIAVHAPFLLAAHAYVRYLGDLSGGQILHDVVCRSYALTGESGTRFYAFEGEIAALAHALRQGLDMVPIDAGEADAIVDEALAAFALHVRLFEELEWP